MSIIINKNQDKTIIEINNGHAKALEKIVNDYGLIGEEEALGFMLSVVSQANGGKIETPSGVFVPSGSIKKSSNNDNQ